MATDVERVSRLMLDEFKRVHERLDGMSQRLDGIEGRLDVIDARLSHIELEITQINRRLDKLEEDVGNLKGFAKEIDELRDRIRDIEKHLGINKKIAA